MIGVFKVVAKWVSELMIFLVTCIIFAGTLLQNFLYIFSVTLEFICLMTSNYFLSQVLSGGVLVVKSFVCCV